MSEANNYLISDRSLLESSGEEKYYLFRLILSSSFLSVLTSLSLAIKESITMHYVGHLEDPHESAVIGASLNWMSITSQILSLSLSLGFSILASNAFGTKNFHKLKIYYQQGVILLGGITVISLIISVFTQPILEAFLDDPEFSIAVSKVSYAQIPGTIGFAVFQFTRAYLISQDIFDIPSYILAGSVALHLPLTILFVHGLEYKSVGAGIASSISDLVSGVAVHLYSQYRNRVTGHQIVWNGEWVRGFVGFVKEVGIHASSIFVDWLTFQISYFVIMFLGDYNIFYAHSAMMNYVYIIQMVIEGMAITISTYVSNFSGEGSVEKARKFAYFGLLLCLVCSIIFELLTSVLRTEIAIYYTDDPATEHFASKMIRIYCYGLLFDLGSNFLGYTLRALGQNSYVMKSYLFSYLLIGLSCSIYLGFGDDLGYKGVWMGMVIGFFVMFGFLLFRFVRLNWEHEIKKIHTTVQESKGMLERDQAREIEI